MTEPRERAIQELYEADQVDGWVPPDDLTGRASRLTLGVLEHRAELDRSIAAAAEHWTIERMPVVDRAVLRLGLFELRYEPDVPTAVVLSEAVRIGKAFSTERSGGFINGVLATLAREERPATAATPDDPPSGSG